MTNKLNGQKNIYNIIRKEKLDVVNKPIAKAHGLPNECYNNIEYLPKRGYLRSFNYYAYIFIGAKSYLNPYSLRDITILIFK